MAPTDGDDMNRVVGSDEHDDSQRQDDANERDTGARDVVDLPGEEASTDAGDEGDEPSSTETGFRSEVGNYAEWGTAEPVVGRIEHPPTAAERWERAIEQKGEVSSPDIEDLAFAEEDGDESSTAEAEGSSAMDQQEGPGEGTETYGTITPLNPIAEFPAAFEGAGSAKDGVENEDGDGAAWDPFSGEGEQEPPYAQVSPDWAEASFNPEDFPVPEEVPAQEGAAEEFVDTGEQGGRQWPSTEPRYGASPYGSVDDDDNEYEDGYDDQDAVAGAYDNDDDDDDDEYESSFDRDEDDYYGGGPGGGGGRFDGIKGKLPRWAFPVAAVAASLLVAVVLFPLFRSSDSGAEKTLNDFWAAANSDDGAKAHALLCQQQARVNTPDSLTAEFEDLPEIKISITRVGKETEELSPDNKPIKQVIIETQAQQEGKKAGTLKALMVREDGNWRYCGNAT